MTFRETEDLLDRLENLTREEGANMLVLTRREGEEIVIGNDVRVRVTKIDGNKVRLAIDAPRTVPIMREELLDRWALTDPDGPGRADAAADVGDDLRSTPPGSRPGESNVSR